MKLGEMQTSKSAQQSAYDIVLNALENAGIDCFDDGESIVINLGDGRKAIVDVGLL